MRVGVVSLQGDFVSHINLLRNLGVETLEIRYPQQLAEVDALILPGGESTTWNILLRAQGILEPLLHHVQYKPTLATCAGLILLSQHQMLGVTVLRNGYGSQIASFEGSLGKAGSALFIRAPKIVEMAADVYPLAYYHQEVVAIHQNHMIGLTCHPELIGNPYFHQLLIDQMLATKAACSI